MAATATPDSPAQPSAEFVDREVVHLDPKLIRWLPAKKEERTRNPKFAENLAQSIDTDGLLVYPIVRSDPDKPGHYIGVDGWHRFTGITKWLKWKTIPVIVDDGGSEDDYRSKTIAANLFRNGLSKAQENKAIADWHKIYEARMETYKAAKLREKEAKKQQAKAVKEAPAEVVETPAATEPTAEVQIGPDATTETPATPPTEPESAVELPPKPPENFAKDVAAATGRSVTAVKRSVKIGKAFSDEQLRTLDAEKVTQDLCETLADLPQHQRDVAVSLIASGMDPTEAIGEVTRRDEIKTASGQVRSTKDGEADEKDLSNDDWIATYCPEALARLPEDARPRFRMQAILYRETRKARALFGDKFAGPLDRARKTEVGGMHTGLAGALGKVASVEHPKNWCLCGTCTGTGVGANKKNCNECYGLGFKVTFGKVK